MKKTSLTAVTLRMKLLMSWASVLTTSSFKATISICPNRSKTIIASKLKKSAMELYTQLDRFLKQIGTGSKSTTYILIPT